MNSDPSLLHYDDRGTGPALLLIHGFPLCRRMWEPQAETLARAGYRLLTPDLPGFGASPAPAPPWTMDDFAASVIGLLDRLGLAKAVVGGMSMGGYVLLNLLARYPERVTAAMFIATRAGGDDPAAKVRRTRLAEAALAGEVELVAGAFGDILFGGDTPGRRPELVEQVRGWMAQASPGGLAAGLLAMRDRDDYTDRLREVRVPSLVISGADDRAVPREQFDLLADRLPGARSCLIPGGGHLINLEQPAAFNACLLDFLAGLKVSSPES